MEGIVYKCTHKDGRVYIGITTHTLKERIKKHYYDLKKNHKFQKALSKYPKDYFTWEVIDNANTMKELKQKEIYYVDLYNSYNKGFNSTIGGDACPVNSGKDNKRSKTVLQYDLNGNQINIFESSGIAAKQMKVHYNSINYACRNKILCKGYVWLYEHEVYLLPEILAHKNCKLIMGKEIEQYSKEGKFLNSYPSIVQAAKDNNCCVDTIGKCLQGVNKTGLGYIWKYKGE